MKTPGETIEAAAGESETPQTKEKTWSDGVMEMEGAVKGVVSFRL